MPDKLSPDGDLLCYFFRPSATAALSNASASGFTVSGSWRQQFDWCVIDWVRDNTFEHPAFRNLPDGDLSGLTLSYEETRENCIPMDSDLFPTIDWPSLRVWSSVAGLETLSFVALKQYATPVAGNYTCASATVTLQGTITAGDYVGIAFSGEHYTYQLLGGDTVDSVTGAIVDSINAFSPNTSATHVAGLVTVVYVGQDSSGTKLTPTTSTTGANGNRLGLYTYTTGSTMSWDIASRQFSGGTSPTKWRYTIPFGTLHDRDGLLVSTTDVRKLRWTYSAELQAGVYARSEFAVQVTNWTVTGTGRTYSVAGPGSRRYEDSDLSLVYSGSWKSSKGNFSNGTISYTTVPGASVTCSYNATQTHSLYLGTRAAFIGGSVPLKVDGQVVHTENLLLAGEDVLVRRLVGVYPAGAHTIQVTHNGTADSYFYFDFIETAQPTNDLPSYPTEWKVTMATDWDTDHSLALAPERTARMLTDLGFRGRHNLYVGALEFYELYPKDFTYASQTVTFTGTPTPSSIISLSIQHVTDPSTTIQHLIHAGDTPVTIAKAFELELNKGYTAVRALSSGAVLTIFARTIGNDGNLLKVTSSPSSGAFYGAVPTAKFSGGATGTWTTDLTAMPRINRAARDWMSAFFVALKGYGISVTAAFSTEIGNGDPSSSVAQRYPDHSAVVVSTPALQTNFSPDSIAYWRQVYLDAAKLQADAGLQPYLQFGEVQWWYFPNPSGMTFYDDYTTSTFQAQYGRPMAVIATDKVNPALHPEEAAFLPTLIGAYTTAIMNFVRATYSNARFEVLYPTDVNEGAFNEVINYPTASWTPATLTNLKTESFTYTLDRNLQLAEQRSLHFGESLGFSRAQRSHLIGVSDPTTAWMREARLAQTLTADSVVLFALDQFCLIGYPMPLPHGLRRAKFNK